MEESGGGRSREVHRVTNNSAWRPEVKEPTTKADGDSSVPEGQEEAAKTASRKVAGAVKEERKDGKGRNTIN